MMVLSHIEEQKLIAIIRGYNPEEAVSIAGALKAGGIRLVEITLNSPQAIKAIEAVSEHFGDEMLVGAGTVLDPESARAALLAGARFILSPTVNEETIKLTKRYGAVSIPGAFTPTEILTAYESGETSSRYFPEQWGLAISRISTDRFRIFRCFRLEESDWKTFTSFCRPVRSERESAVRLFGLIKMLMTRS